MMLGWILFLAAGLFIVYVIAGYPLLLSWLARHRPRPVQQAPQRKTVSVVIAVYNGEAFLAAKLDSLLVQTYPRDLTEIIVVSDGSTDRTAAIARQYAPQRVTLLEVPNGGKPAALNAGIARAQGEILVLTDVRQELHPEGIARLLANFADPHVGVVSGDLLIRQGRNAQEENVGLYRRYESALRTNLGLYDSIFGATGSFYAMRRELAVPMPPETLLDDMYLPLAAFFRGYRLIFEPTAHAYDYPTALKAEFGRKVRTLAGNYQIMQQYPALLGPQNRLWLHFMSYKFGRLVLPYAFLLLFLSSFLLPAPFNYVALAGQAAFYGAALIDQWLPESFVLKRLTSPALTIVTMLWATVCALRIFFVPAQKLWQPTQIRVAKPS